jgi:hypothetical protein
MTPEEIERDAIRRALEALADTDDPDEMRRCLEEARRIIAAALAEAGQ